MQIEYLSPTGVVQTTKVEGPVPETGHRFFDLSLELYRCRSLSLLFALHFSRQFQILPARSAHHLPHEASPRMAFEKESRGRYGFSGFGRK